jgi:hypothetical protein
MPGYGPRQKPKQRPFPKSGESGIKHTLVEMDSTGIIRDKRPRKPPSADEIRLMKKREAQRKNNVI